MRLLRLVTIVSAVLAILALAGDGAWAAKKQKKPPPPPKEPYELPMKVVIVRSSEPGCEPNCPEWIAAEGELTAASPAAFRKAPKLAGKKKLPVVLRSPGGEIDAAIQIGRMIRKNGLDVSIGWTNFTGCAPTDKACKLPKSQKGVYRGTALSFAGFCYSACPLILAAGQQRLAGIGTYVGVHEIRRRYTEQPVTYRVWYKMVNGKKKEIKREIISRQKARTYEKIGFNKSLRKQLTAYLKDMGVSADLLEDMGKAPPTSIHHLSEARQRELKLVTAPGEVGLLVGRNACAGDPAPVHCILSTDPEVLAAVKAREPALRYDKSLEIMGIGPGDPAMAFTVVRNSGKACEPRCPEWLAAEGAIRPETPELLKKAIDALLGRKVPILFDSRGGDLDAALAMGRMIRAQQLTTGVADTAYLECGLEQENCVKNDAGQPRRGVLLGGGKCIGTCVLAFAGGHRRILERRSPVEFLNPDDLISRTSKMSGSVLVYSYLGGLGFEPRLMDVMRATSPGSRRVLEPYINFFLAETLWTYGGMMEPDACRAPAAFDHCILRLATN